MENVQPHAINVPNEDWASISDVEQRRRIQNRVAQRRHRMPMLPSRCQSMDGWMDG